jgi:hypothetical protein
LINPLKQRDGYDFLDASADSSFRNSALSDWSRTIFSSSFRKVWLSNRLFEIAKQVAHRQHRLQLRYLSSHLLWREIFHALESQLNIVLTTIIRQRIFNGQINFWGIFGKNAVEIIFGDVNFSRSDIERRLLPITEITRNQFQGNSIFLLAPPVCRSSFRLIRALGTSF